MLRASRDGDANAKCNVDDSEAAVLYLCQSDDARDIREERVRERLQGVQVEADIKLQ